MDQREESPPTMGELPTTIDQPEVTQPDVVSPAMMDASHMDVASVWTMLNRLGTEFEKLHTSYHRLHDSSEGRQTLAQATLAHPTSVLLSTLPCPTSSSRPDPLLGEAGSQAPDDLPKIEEGGVQSHSPCVATGSADAATLLEQPYSIVPTHSRVSKRDSLSTSLSMNKCVTENARALIAVFDELDTDGNGKLSAQELRMALLAAGVPQARLGKIMQLADTNDSGSIELDEWISAVKAQIPEMEQWAIKLREKQERDGTLFGKQKQLQWMMIKPLSCGRMSWDFLMSAVCIYLAMGMPFFIAWEDVFSATTADMNASADRMINYVFIFDIVLNFRTGFINNNNELVMEWKAVAKHYLKTFFLIDVVSSLPTEEIQALSSGLQAFKILKFSKFLKLIKLMKPRNVIGHLSEMSDTFYDFAQMKIIQIIMRKSRVFLYMCLLSHWMACGMKLVDTRWLSAYQDVGGHLWPEYWAAVYWAMTTLTTVGYGDITPTNQTERLYATFMMIIGASFYGFVVGAISSVVSSSDLNASVYIERMDLISAWLDHHQFPVQAKRTLHRYFKAYHSKKSAISETEVFEDLPLELQKEAGEYILHENVKHNPIFDGLGIACVVQLQAILRKVALQHGSCIASQGDVGTAMYIVFSGSLEMVRGERTSSAGDTLREGSSRRQIVPGQSFGEEFLLGFASRFEYTVTANEKCELEMIRQDEFLKVFEKTYPAAMERMRKNALEMKPEWGFRQRSVYEHVLPVELPPRSHTNATDDSKKLDAAPVVSRLPPTSENPEAPSAVLLPSQVT